MCWIKSQYDNKIVCEGRVIYDAFVLNNKKDACYISATETTDLTT